MTRWEWWRWRSIEFAVAITFVVAALFMTDTVRQRYRADVPAENWFSVNTLYVPDFRTGGNPTLTYDRQVKEPFLGFWVVEVEKTLDDGKFVLVCSGSGVNDYQVEDFIPKNEVSWGWFIGDTCSDLLPGEYRMRASWKMKRDDWPDKTIVHYSNIFDILP